jgi:OOP family OmpA-OmpF porin
MDLSLSREESFAAQRELAVRFVNMIPDLEYTAAIRTFWQTFNPAPGAKDFSQLIYGPTKMDKAAMSALLAATEFKQGFTPLGPALQAVDADLAKIPGSKVLIIFSDFEESETFGKPVVEAEALKAKYPDLCIISVHYEEKAKSTDVAKQIAYTSRCGRFYESPVLAANDLTMKTMIREVFTQTCPNVLTISMNVEFDFDKSDIRPEYHGEIQRGAEYLIDNPTTTAMVVGNTDDKGTDEYNFELSDRRAASVMNYMVEKFGVARERLNSRGDGESRPVATNETDEGRQMNRRVDAVVSVK